MRSPESLVARRAASRRRILILGSEPQEVGALSTREWCPSAEGWVRLAPKTAATPRRARVRKLTALDST